MHRDDVDALNRVLDELVSEGPATASDIDPDLLARIRWFHDIGQQVVPDPTFTVRLEHELMNTIPLESPASASADPLSSASSLVTRRSGESPHFVPRPLPPWRRATGALVWGSWLLLIGIIVVAIAGRMELWPDRSSSDSPVLAPSVTTQPEDAVDMATHPLVGSWIPPPMGPRGFEMFHADGTVTIANVLDGTGIGVWRPTDERSGEFIVMWPSRNVFEGEYREGRTVLRGTVTVSDDGASYTGTYHVETSTMIGTEPMTYEGETSGTRMSIDQVATATPEG